jgi:hypothetical protein
MQGLNPGGGAQGGKEEPRKKRSPAQVTGKILTGKVLQISVNNYCKLRSTAMQRK